MLIIGSFFVSIATICANPVCDIDEDETIGIGEAIYTLRQGDLKNTITALQIVAGILPPADPMQERFNRLANISNWFSLSWFQSGLGDASADWKFDI